LGLYSNSKFYLYEELTAVIQDWAKAYPKLLKAYSIGKSHRDRDIWVLEISAPTAVSNDEKPGFFVDANTHAEEITGTTAALHIASELLSKYGKDDTITRLLETTTFYVVPRLNPDGAEIVMTMPFYEYIGNGRYMPGDEQVGPGLHYADVNGDGIIVDMRIPDPNGEWKISEKDSRIMVQREPFEEGGDYYRVVPEGIIEGFDGAEITIPPPRDGNLNRQYSYAWGPEGEQYGGGEYPGSEPEAAAILRFHDAHPNIAGVLNFHTNAGVLLPPSHIAGKPMPLNDRFVIERIGKLGEKLTGYPLLGSEDDFSFPGAHHRMGTATDYLYGQLGIINFVVEFWDVVKESGIKNAPLFPLGARSEDENAKLLKWSDEKLNGEGFLPWTPFEHPQLGPVEIGGWRRLYMFRNPPEGEHLEKACSNMAKFALQFAAAAPRVGIENMTVTDQGSGMYRINANVANQGFLPTNLTDRAIDIKIAKSVVVELSLPNGTELISGMARVDLGNLEGRSQRTKRYSRFFDWGTPAKAVEWVVRQVKPANDKEQVTIQVISEKAGTVRMPVRLSK